MWCYIILFEQVIVKFIRVIWKLCILFVYVIVNDVVKFICYGVIFCGIVSDYDGFFVCVNIWVFCYQLRYMLGI